MKSIIYNNEESISRSEGGKVGKAVSPGLHIYFIWIILPCTNPIGIPGQSTVAVLAQVAITTSQPCFSHAVRVLHPGEAPLDAVRGVRHGRTLN